jgi:hypothetical protein
LRGIRRSLADGGVYLAQEREKALEYFRDAGFADVKINELSYDVQNYYYICHP